jgi:hypothetical protein
VLVVGVGGMFCLDFLIRDKLRFTFTFTRVFPPQLNSRMEWSVPSYWLLARLYASESLP